MSKRYIFFVGTLSNGGAERVISILASHMAAQGMPTEIVTYYDRPVFYQLHPKVMLTSVEACTGKSGKFDNLLWLRRYFKENAKVVLSFLAPFNMLALLVSVGLKTPVIVADRNDPTRVPGNVVLRKLRDFLYRFADYIVVQTKNNQQYFSAAVQKKSTVIYNPVECAREQGCALQCEKKKQIVTAGRLLPQKNQKLLLAAFSDIAKKYPQYQLVIYGEGSEREVLEQEAQRLGIENQVVFEGKVADLHERMKSAELFVLSSDYEGMPNALIEAMCLGLPVISTKVSGATDLIEDGKNGLLVERKDRKALAEAMERLIMEEAFRTQLAFEAAKLSEQLLPEVILKQWLEMIGRIVR